MARFELAASCSQSINAIFCLIPHRSPLRSVTGSPETDLFVGLAVLSVAAMTLGLLVSAVVSKLEHAVAIVTLASIGQITLNGITSSMASFFPIAAVAAALPDRWGLAATASSADLRHIQPGIPADALWHHTSGQWIWDLAAMAGLSVAFFVIAVVFLHLRLRLPTGRKQSGQPRPRWITGTTAPPNLVVTNPDTP